MTRNNYWVCDIEAQMVLNPTVIWCVCVENLGTDEKHVFTDSISFRKFVDLRSDCIWVGHNILSFDKPWALSLWEVLLNPVVDTLVCDYLFNPKILGGHSLEAVGQRFGQPKVIHTDWSKFSPEMLHRCQEDVSITKRLYINLIKKMRAVGFSEASVALEHRIREIVDDQQRNGFLFQRPQGTSFCENS